MSLSLGMLLCLGSGRVVVAQDADPSAPPQQANTAILSQLFPGQTIPPDKLQQYRTIQVDLNGDKIKEWVVVYNPNAVAQKKKPKRKGCLCPKPKAEGDAKTLKMISQVKSTLEKYEDYLYQVKVTGKKSKKIHVWYQLEKKPPMKEGDLAFQVVRRIGRKLGRWKRWRVRELILVNVDNGTTFKFSAWRAKKVASTPSRKREKVFKRWYKQTGETDIPLCKCPKKKPKRVVFKSLEIIVATEIPAPPAARPTEPTPEPAAAPAGPKVLEVGRLRADNVELRPITRGGDIFAIQCENSVSLGTLRKQEQTFYTYDHLNKKLQNILTLTTSREGEESDAAGRQWSQFKFQNMDADEWLELVVDHYYETPNFNGMLGHTMYKYQGGTYKPLNQARGLLSISTSSTWDRVGPKGTRAEQARLSMRTRKKNVADGFRDTIWVANKSPRGIGEWVRIVFMKPRSLLGVAVSAQIPTMLKHVADEYYPGGESSAPKLVAPSFLRIQTADSKKYEFALQEGRPYTFFRFPQPVRTAFLRIEIIKEFRDPKTGRTQRLTIPEKEKSLGFLGEVVPVFDEITYTASSFQAQSVESYHPENVGDNKDLTAWGEGRKDDGLGEWIQMMLPMPQQLNTISVSNGCRRPGERYILNNRVKTARLTFSNGSTQDISLKDTEAKQVVTFRPVRTSSIRLTILSIYKGKIGNLTCITELHPGR
ncbi:MAG: hypothetical protein H6728_02880 [Myxococcales bacterium]|nr:hypothetical protein [Myxococcales bacterium]MCB9641998.1 hypothetical protein [Myxococcales bacterium]